MSVSYAESGGFEMKRKFYDGQLVRVIGADWTFRAVCWMRMGLSVWGQTNEDGNFVAVWPGYLLEAA